MKQNLAVVVALVGLVFAGCASLMNGSQQSVSLDSQPVGVRARIDGVQTVTTPAIVDLERRHSHLIVFQSPGYNDASTTIDSDWSPWLIGNIVFGPLFGIVGVLVDFHTGGAFVLATDRAYASLEPNANMRYGAAHGAPPKYKLTCWQGDAQRACP